MARVPLLPPAAPDFSDPLGLMAACHGRMLEHCRLLQKMLAWLPGHGADGQIRDGAQKIIRYFETAARDHHADEEQDLFPVLEQSAAMAELIEDLRLDHGRLEAAWDTLAPQLRALADGRIPETLAQAAETFIASYRAHIETENMHILPVARRSLDAEQLRVLGIAMAHRRGAEPPQPSAAGSD